MVDIPANERHVMKYAIALRDQPIQFAADNLFALSPEPISPRQLNLFQCPECNKPDNQRHHNKTGEESSGPISSRQLRENPTGQRAEKQNEQHIQKSILKKLVGFFSG